MRGERHGYIGSRDFAEEKKEQRAKERAEKEESRKRKYAEEQEKAEDAQRRAWSDLEKHLGDEAEPSCSKDSDKAKEYEPARKRRRKDIPDLAVPRDILTQQPVLDASVRNKLSCEGLAEIFSAIVKCSKGNLKNYSVGADNVRKRKSKKLINVAKVNQENWVAPEHPILCWDEKKMKRHGKVENRMPILIAGDERPAKHIATFKLPDGKGGTVARAVKRKAEEWGVHEKEGGKKPCLSIMDTTNSNSGEKRNFITLLYYPLDFRYFNRISKKN